MPGLAQRSDNYQFSSFTTSLSNGSVSVNGFWSQHGGDVSYNQLQKFWGALSPQARQELLRMDKQTLFEQARKNMYCSRCNGLLLEGFLQIVMYGKSLQQEGAVGYIPCNRLGTSKIQNSGDLCIATKCHDDVQDPSVHPWGGLTTTRDGTLTLLDCYLYSKSLKGLQNVFDSARARERERELLYPDACGGGGRGWISQGIASYGRGHGTRETCALHTAGLSVDTLVDFWSALGEETRQSLLRMKEEDFIERLMYRFDSKRFCRDCRRNVIREFKELKELKRVRREPRCTSWFCVADTSFQYEVSHDTVQADWHQTFTDTFGTYHHFEWAVGSGEGKSDILEFENVGLREKVQVKGLDLTGVNACYITLRAWKMDGRCTELSVKAHALKGQQCVHCRLVVGDGFVTITRGESIRRFFEHAEEAEEEEDDDSMDKDGNELDGECSRPQKHAKSPELAREFLLDAATVIFKEQVEKAFREGTARQNAHSIFVSLALKLLEARVQVACKEILTLEKQMKLLEEEEKEKREEEERKERRRMKEREKKLRRKERLREKEKDREKKCSQTNQHVDPDVRIEESTPSVDEEPYVIDNEDPIISGTGDVMSSRPASPDIQDEQFLNGYISSNMHDHSDDSHGVFTSIKDENGSFGVDHLKYSRRRPKLWKEFQPDPTSKWSDRRRFAAVCESGGMVSKSEQHGLNKQSRSNAGKSNPRISGPKFAERLHCSSRLSDRYDFHACSCYQHNDYRPKLESHCSVTRVGWEGKSVCKFESASDMSKPYNSGNKYTQVDYMRESGGRPRTKFVAGNNSPHTKQVWEPMESQKNYPRSISESDVTLSCTFNAEVTEPENPLESLGAISCDEVNGNTVGIKCEDDNLKESRQCMPEMDKNCQNGFHFESKTPRYSKEATDEEAEMSPMTLPSLTGTTNPSMSGTSNSDSCSSCLSEGDSNGSSSNPQNPESSSTSDSEDSSLQSEGRKTLRRLRNGFHECEEVGMDKKKIVDVEPFRNSAVDSGGIYTSGNLAKTIAQKYDDGKPDVSNMASQPQGVLPPMHSQSIPFPVFQPPSMNYYHQSPVSWPAAPANGLMPLPHPSHYVFASSFRYGMNGNSHFMQYGGLQHLAPPILNTSQLPFYQPVARTNGINSKNAKISDLGGVKEAHREANMHRVIPTRKGPMEEQPNAEGEQNGDTDKSHTGNTGFSLFHFGGPVALANGYKSDPLPSKEADANLSSNKSADHIEGDRICNKTDAIEEYNLFAASNGIRFSIF